MPQFRFLSHVDSLLTIGDRYWQKVAAMVEKAESANAPLFAWNWCLFMWGTYFCMGAYKCDVVVLIKMGAYIHGMLILCGCLLFWFYGIEGVPTIWTPILYVAAPGKFIPLRILITLPRLKPCCTELSLRAWLIHSA